MAGIRIVTSSLCGTQLEDAFKAGLTSEGYGETTVEKVELDGKYDDKEGAGVSDLYTEMQAADDEPGVKVVVSAGGLVAAHAANKMIKKKPFLVIIGQEPKKFDLDAETFCGGVNLGMVSQNIARHNHLVEHYTVDKDKVCLIWNKNSKMGEEERKDWKRHKWPDEPVTNNAKNDIDNAIANAAKQFDAAVISGDPYFAAHRDWVVTAANGTSMKVCYPFNLYALSSPTKKSSMIFGPDLEAAYELTGKKAATVLKTLAMGSPLDTGIDSCPTVGPVWIGEP